jgi:hypothetical protein
MNPGRVRAAFVIAAIAVACGIAGAAIDHRLVAHGPRRGRGGAPGSFSPEASARRRAEMLERMTKDLALTPAQRAGIDSIMQHTDSALYVVRSEMEPRLRQIFDSSRAQISTRLDSAQRMKFLARKPEGRARR